MFLQEQNVLFYIYASMFLRERKYQKKIIMFLQERD